MLLFGLRLGLGLVLRKARKVDGHGLALFGDPLAANRLLDRDLEVVAVRGRRRSDLELDDVVDDELDEVLRKALHVMVGAVLDRLGEAVRLLGLADQLGDAGGVDHHLDGRDPAADLARDEPLADDAAQNAGQDLAHHHLLLGRVELDEPADRLGRVERVQRREDEVARTRPPGGRSASSPRREARRSG